MVDAKLNGVSAVRSSARLLAALVAGVLLLVGCMGDDDKSTRGGTTTGETDEGSVRAVYDFPHKTPSEVEAFWTKERMEGAKAKELPRVLGALESGPPPAADGPPVAVDGSLPGAAPSSVDVRTDAAIEPPPESNVAPRRAKLKYKRYRWRTSHKVPPAAMWGKFLVDRGSGGEEWCSGTVVASNSKSLVWTAAHCLYDPIEQEWFNNNVVFVPGYDNGDAPFGQWVVRTLFVHPKWMKKRGGYENFGYDFGAVIVEPLNGQYIADVVGQQGIYFSLARKWRYMSGGYPVNKPFNGEDLFICDARLGRVDRAFRPATTGIGCDMTGGSSGGGWLIALGQQGKGLGWIFGHNSYGPIDRRTRKELPEMYTPYYGKEALAWWKARAQ